MKVLDYSEPVFSWVNYDLTGLGLLQRARFLWSNPPRIIFKKEWKIRLLDDAGRAVSLVFPVGFITDCASIPRVFWAIPGFSPFGALRPGSIPHDMGYQLGYLLTTAADWLPSIKERHYYNRHADAFGELRPLYVGYGQQYFDNLMRHLVIEVNQAAFAANIACWVLRICGRKAWSNYRRHGPGAYGADSIGLPGVLEG